MPKGIKGFKKDHKHSQATKDKISKALSKKVEFNCDMCGKLSHEPPSHYKKKKRHFCCMNCYSAFRKTKLPKEEQHAFGSGFSEEERERRRKCRSITNKAIQRNKLLREPCEVCGVVNSEAHHDDYTKPLSVRWLCFKHHREHHKIYENKELLTQ